MTQESHLSHFSGFHSLLFWPPYLLQLQGRNCKRCARGWDQKCAWNKERRRTQQLKFCFWQLCLFSFEGHVGPMENAGLAAWESMGKPSLIWRIRPLMRVYRTGLPRICYWATPDAKKKDRENRLEDQETWIPAPVPPLTTTTAVGKPPRGTKRVASENSLQHYCPSVSVYNEKAQRTCISIGPLGLDFQFRDQDSLLGGKKKKIQ